MGTLYRRFPTKDELVPSARLRYLSGVRTIVQGSSYSCRNIRGSRTASEHSKGNAIDVMRIVLSLALARREAPHDTFRTVIGSTTARQT